MDYRRYISTVTFAGDSVLKEWRWLVGPRLQLWLVTKAGDALLRDPEDGSVHFLNTISATIERVAESDAEFELFVAEEDNAREWLLTPLVDELALRGTSPGTDQCFHFKIPPVLGGVARPENMVVIGLTDRFGGMGQVMRQINDLPEGTQVVIRPNSQDEATKRPWWKFW
jgi:hypothetical protein